MYYVICFLVSVLVFNVVFFGSLAIRYVWEKKEMGKADKRYVPLSGRRKDK